MLFFYSRLKPVCDAVLHDAQQLYMRTISYISHIDVWHFVSCFNVGLWLPFSIFIHLGISSIKHRAVKVPCVKKIRVVHEKTRLLT